MMEFIDLKSQYKALKEEIDLGISQVLDNSHFILGDKVGEFETKLASFTGMKHVVACSDGTAALQLIYMAYGIGQGDAVFCPDMTFIASIEPACLLGATPVFCDIDPISYNLEPVSLENQIKAVIEEGKLKPRAIVAVDFVGNPADYDNLREIAARYKLLLIEDAAQGMGASYQGKRCGSLGDIAATSFFPSKPLGCYGDGGAVFTNDDDMAQKLRSLRVHGKGEDKYHNIYIGINSRLDELQAAILLPKLAVLEEEIDRRQEVAETYAEALGGHYFVPRIKTGSISSFAQYVVRSHKPGKRNEIVEGLKKAGVPSILYYPVPMHRLPVFAGLNSYTEKFANTNLYSEEHFGIPFSPYMSKADQEKVIQSLLQCAGV